MTVAGYALLLSLLVPMQFGSPSVASNRYFGLASLTVPRSFAAAVTASAVAVPLPSGVVAAIAAFICAPFLAPICTPRPSSTT